MGYCIHVVDSEFYIRAEDKQKALKAMKAMIGSFSWVSASEIKGFRNLEEGLECWGYSPDVDDDGNITNVSFNSEKLGEEHKMFRAIASFVKEGSFIEVSGEDGEAWRWIFKGGDCKEVHADKSFDEDEEDSIPRSLVLKIAQAVRTKCDGFQYASTVITDEALEKVISQCLTEARVTNDRRQG